MMTQIPTDIDAICPYCHTLRRFTRRRDGYFQCTKCGRTASPEELGKYSPHLNKANRKQEAPGQRELF